MGIKTRIVALVLAMAFAVSSALPIAASARAVRADGKHYGVPPNKKHKHKKKPTKHHKKHKAKKHHKKKTHKKKHKKHKKKTHKKKTHKKKTHKKHKKK